MAERDRDGSITGCNMKSSLVKAKINYEIQLEKHQESHCWSPSDRIN